MTRKNSAVRGVLAGVGALLLATVALASAANAEDLVEDGPVDVLVDISPRGAGGTLAMTIAGTSVTLTENGSDDLVRQFTGTLPTVTVTDTRDPDDITPGAYWYVVGSASAFEGDAAQPDIGAEFLGWAPHLTDGDPASVSEGDQVLTASDSPTDPSFPDNVGLVDQELLAMASDSATIASEGQWSANADLFLRVAATVEPGAYQSVLTLSLFE